jgi:predicted transcriptional regulator
MIRFPKDPRQLGPALAEYRRMLGVTQDDLVNAGVGNQGVISALENGHTIPQVPTVMAYLDALGGFELAGARFPDSEGT